MSKKTPSEHDNDLFRQMMADVKPLPADNRVEHEAQKPSPKPKPKSRPKYSEAETASEFIERDYAAPVDPEETLFFAHSGLQHRLQQRLKRGDIPVEARLDLHGQTIAEAGDTLAQFLRAAQENGCRCVLVVHGKGQRSQQGKPVLKTQVNHWLRQHDAVLGFSSAQTRHGGAGALYVLLRRH